MRNVSEILGDVDSLDIMGYAPFEEQNRLMGDIMTLGEGDRKKAITKVLSPKFGAANLDARDKTIQRLGALPKEIRDALNAKRLQIVDAEYYTVKPLSTQKNVRFFEDADTMLPGLRNISNAKFIKDVYFLCTHIQFTVGISAITDNTLVPYDAFFDNPANVSEIANGEFEFKANGNKYMVPKDSPLSMFSDVQFGGLKDDAKFTRTISNPKWIEPQVPLEFNIRAANTIPTPAGLYTWGKFKMIGCAIINY